MFKYEDEWPIYIYAMEEADMPQWMLSEREYDVLKKFRHPSAVSEQDKDLVNELTAQSFLDQGFKEDRDTHKLTPTARLTDLGRRIFQHEQMTREGLSWSRKILYRLAALLS